MSENQRPALGVWRAGAHPWRIDVRLAPGETMIEGCAPAEDAPAEVRAEYERALDTMRASLCAERAPMVRAAASAPKISGHVEATDWDALCGLVGGHRAARVRLAARLASMPALVDAPRRAPRMKDARMVAVFVPADVAARHSTTRGSAAAALRAAMAEEIEAAVTLVNSERKTERG